MKEEKMSKWIMKIPIVVSTTEIQLTDKQKDKVIQAAKDKKTMVEINNGMYITTDFISITREDNEKIN